jgi:hypothetical protein
MTVITRDKNFELLPEADAENGAVFGIGQDVSLDDGGFIPGSTDWAIQDGENSQNGATSFGRDRLVGPTWSWQLHINRATEQEALATLRPFRAAWHALHIRDTPGAVIPLRYQLEGERRRIYGRPRRFEAPPDNKILSGYVPVQVDFKCVDGFVYDDVMREAVLQVGKELEDPNVDSGGGFVFPLTFPHVTLPPTRQQTQLSIGGDAPAYPIVRFNGPIVNPRLVTDDWTLSLDYTIPDGQYVEIDTRPWRMTALLNGNASVAGFLGRRQRLSQVRFKPGRFEARLVGFSSSVATCSVRWAPTYNSY